MDAGVGGEVPAVFGAALAIADRISCECLGNKADIEKRRVKEEEEGCGEFVAQKGQVYPISFSLVDI